MCELNVKIRGKAAEDLKKLAAAEGVTEERLLERTIAVYLAVQPRLKTGGKLFLANEDNTEENLIDIPWYRTTAAS